MYTPAQREFDNIQNEVVRKKIDTKFNTAHDELSVAYYDYWKQGDYSVEFQGYKPANGATAEEAKLLFDELHGYIHLKHDDDLYTEVKSTFEDGNDFTQTMETVRGNNGKTRIQEVRDKKKEFEDKGIEVIV